MQPLRIFLVENHEDTVRYMQLYLEHLGHSVVTARDLSSALSAWPESDCDVLISDIRLPDGDGWSLMERISEKRPICGIAMSGYGMDADLEKSRAVGFQYHLIKPFAPSKLEEILRQVAKSAPDQGKPGTKEQNA